MVLLWRRLLSFPLQVRAEGAAPDATSADADQAAPEAGRALPLASEWQACVAPCSFLLHAGSRSRASEAVPPPPRTRGAREQRPVGDALW
jgi:hypothetical protein